MLAGAALLVVAGSIAGCVREGPSPGQSVAGPGVTLESDQQFVLLDKSIEDKFSFHNAVTRRVENGRLEVIVDIRNRTDHNQALDISTLFRDEQKVALRDETAWARHLFGPNQTRAYRAVSIDSRAACFTVRLREGR